MSGRWLRIAPERQLHAVAHDVVLERLDRQRILRVQRLQPALRHAERIVAEIDLLGFLVQLEHREVGDPAEAERALLASGRVPRPAGCAPGRRISARRPACRRRRTPRRRGSRPQAGADRLRAVRLRGCARSAPSGRPRRRRCSRGRRRLRPLPSRSACRRSCAAATRHPVRGSRAPRRPTRRCAQTSRSPSRRSAAVTSLIRSGLRRSGLSRADIPASPCRRECDGTAAASTARPSANSSNTPAMHRLDRREHVVLRDVAHLEVELIELAGRAVGARGLVAEARRDLEVAVEARDHQQLLELLRRLRQRVELAGMQPRRHQEVARALGASRRSGSASGTR